MIYRSISHKTKQLKRIKIVNNSDLIKLFKVFTKSRKGKGISLLRKEIALPVIILIQLRFKQLKNKQK